MRASVADTCGGSGINVSQFTNHLMLHQAAHQCTVTMAFRCMQHHGSSTPH